MLTISQSAVRAMSQEAEQRRKMRFLNWVQSLADTIGPFPAEHVAAAYDVALIEAARAELDSDARLFDFALAKLLMPEMNGMQYIIVMDVVFSHLAPHERVNEILRVRDQYHG